MPGLRRYAQILDEAKIRDLKGVRRIVRLPNAVAVVADSWWQAKQAVDALPVTWDEGQNGKVSSASIAELLSGGLIAPEAAVVRKDDDFEAALGKAAKRVEAEYAAPYLAQATMEPMNCTAHVTQDGVEVWAPTQSGEGSLAAVVAPEKVVVHRTMLGGGFGWRGTVQDFVHQAVLIAKAVGQPVKLLWAREDDIRHDFYRPAAMVRFSAGLDASGVPIAWRVRVTGPSIIASPLRQRLANGASIGQPPTALRTRWLTTSPTTRSTTRCARPMCRSASGARWITRKMAFSVSASSTRWRVPRARIHTSSVVIS